MLKRFSQEHPVAAALLVLLAVIVLRMLDVFVIRSDELVGEQFLTKIVGLLLIVAYAWHVKGSLGCIGLHARAWLFSVVLGLGIMAAGLVAGYGAEWAYLAHTGAQPALLLEAQGNTLIPEDFATGGVLFGLVLVLGNVINSFMEEGVFRGLLMTHLGARMRIAAANLIQAAIFGVWHIVWPVRDYLDGRTSLATALTMSAGYIVLSGLIGFAWGYFYQNTDSLWASWAAHTLNNTLSNLLHIVTPAGMPNTMGIRAVVIALTVVALLPLVKKAAAARGLRGLTVWV